MKKVLFSLILLVLTFLSCISYANSNINVNSKNVIAIDRKSLSILFEKNGNNSIPMASTTKIMTCIVALENSSLDSIVTVSKEASKINGSTLGLHSDQKITMNDLLYGLMLRSGNDCAIAIAEYISGSVENFAVLMNNKAKELNLSKTNFVTPHGLDNKNHYTSAYDLAILTDYALKNDKFKEIVSTKSTTITIDNQTRSIQNTNELLGNFDGVYGVKTGFTFEAGRCLVSACIRGDMDIIVVVLGADTKSMRTQDSKKIINYIFENYEYINLENTIYENFENSIDDISKNLTLNKTTNIPEFYLENIDNYEFPFLKNEVPSLTFKYNLQTIYSPNVRKNSSVGVLSIYNNQNLITKINIYLKNSLSKNTWTFYFQKCLCDLF